MDVHSVQLGNEYLPGYPARNVTVSGEDLAMNPGTAGGFGDLSYATYSFFMPYTEDVPELRLIWAAAPPAGNVWVGLANYETDRWDWLPAERQESVLDRDLVVLPGWDDYISASLQRLFFVVVVTGGQGGSLHRARLGRAFNNGTVSPLSALQPVEVTTDLSFASIPNSVPVSFSIDYGNDGTEDSAALISQHLYSSVGVQTTRVSITNNEGLTATKLFETHVLGGTWELQTITPPAAVGDLNYGAKTGLIDGRPAVAYLHSVNGGLDEFSVQYMIASDESGGSWLGPFTVYSSTSDVPEEIGGVQQNIIGPGVAFRTDSGIVNYCRCSGDGTDQQEWGSPILIADGMAGDGMGLALGYSTLGRPLVAYTTLVPVLGWTCWLTRAADSDGSGPWAPIAIVGEGRGEVGFYADGVSNVQVAVHKSAANEVVMYLSDDPSGESAAAWEQRVTEVTNIPFGPGNGPVIIPSRSYPISLCAYSAQLVFIEGMVMLANLDTDEKALLTFEGDSWISTHPNILERYEIFTGYDREPGDLVSLLVETSGMTFPTRLEQPVDTAGDVGRGSSICAPLGIPLIVYEDADNRSIKVAVMK
jgi:hypothetical protein